LATFLDEQEPKWHQAEYSADDQPEWLKPAVNALGKEVVSRINAAAVINPINLLSLSILASPKHTMDEEQLREQLRLYINLLEKAPYSPHNIISENDADTVINYGLEKEFIHHIKHPHGDLINSDDVTALQMTYIRNNTLHLFILPGLIAALMRNRQEMDLARFKQLINLLYPFFRTEYFLHWQDDQLDTALQKVLSVLIEQGLIKEKNGTLRGSKTYTSEAELLDHLAQPVLQPLQRFALTIRILVQHGNAVLKASELEELAHQTAQRLSLLYEFNSPEFFDRHVLRNFIQQLNHFGLTQEDDQGALTFTEALQALDDEAERLLNPEVSQTISRLTRLPLQRRNVVNSAESQG
jgi:glycerol-3-phosphate O-acyltransferase